MGYWGFYLFQSDHDHEVRCMLEQDIGGRPILDFDSEALEKKTKSLLNGGLYQKLITKYEAQQTNDFMDKSSTKIILLTACAMELGVNIYDATKKIVQRHVDDPKNEDFHWEAKQQMLYALENYRSGTKMTCCETALKVAETEEAKAKEKARDDEGEAITTGGMVMMNVAPPPGQDFGMGKVLAAMKKLNLPKKDAKGKTKVEGPMKEMDPNVGATGDMMRLMAKPDSSAGTSKKKPKA